MEDVNTPEEVEIAEERSKNIRRLIAVGVSVAIGAAITIAALASKQQEEDAEIIELDFTPNNPENDDTTEATEKAE